MPFMIHCRSLFVILTLVAAGCGGVQQPDAPDINTLEHAPNPDTPQARGDGMQVEGLWGSLDAEQISGVMMEQMAGFSNCFRKSPGSFVSGEVHLAFVVSSRGRVEQVSVARSDLGAWQVEDCLLKAAKFLIFPPPTGNARARFAYPLMWNQAGDRLALPMQPAWGYQTLSSNKKQLRRCRDRHDFKDAFNVTLYVGRLGEVISAGFDSEVAPKDPELSGCIVSAVEGMRFPDPGGRVVKYRALLEYAPQG
ncbi:MAG: AgmX/PglI C-terminal domain-containing protein [Bradymonadia bacterium]